MYAVSCMYMYLRVNRDNVSPKFQNSKIFKDRVSECIVFVCANGIDNAEIDVHVRALYVTT